MNTLTTKALFKGAGPGTYWHAKDAQLSGFTPSGAFVGTVNAAVNHISAFSVGSPFLSFSTSFAIAREYALTGPDGFASSSRPGYVYQVDLSVLSAWPTLIDPVNFVSSGANGQVSHAHNGGYELISEVAQVNPVVMVFTRPHHQSGGTCSANVSDELRSLVFAIRDAEVLIQGSVPKGAVVHRHNVY